MASLLSGRCSVEQDEELVRRAHQTPKTPIKMSSSSKCGISSAQRRRELFRHASPSSDSSGGLGHMSPLSSSLESLRSLGSPSFSPNGAYYYETPVKALSTSVRTISVSSSLFPALQRKSPRQRRSPKSSQTVRASPNIRQAMVALQDIVADSGSSQTTPKSSRVRRRIIAETNSSPSSVWSPPSQRKSKLSPNIIPPSPAITSPARKSVAEVDFYGAPVAKPVVPVVSPENFYAPAPPSKPINPFAAPRPTMAIDTLGSRGRRIRRDSEVSQRSFVSGVGKRPRSTSRSSSRSGAKRHKGLVPGVWHGIKKPKKMNKNAPKPKPMVSPNTRVEKLKKHPGKSISRGKRLFEEKPRNRVAGKKTDEEGIFDPFPAPLIKRKKLPSTPVKEPEPDNSKKFLKFGAYRPATFQLNNMKLEFKNGQVRMKTPEKVRKIRSKKLYKPELDPVDFTLCEPETTDIQKDVDNILQQLIDGDDNSEIEEKREATMNKLTDEQLMNILDSPSTKVTLVRAKPGQMLTEIHSSPQRSLMTNMSKLALSDSESGRFALGTTGGILSQATNVLNGENEENIENLGSSKVYPVFDPSTWKSTPVLADVSNTKQPRRKNPLVPDDQYMLDAGQKSIGVVCCKECGVIYQAGDYLDEVAHNNVHNHISELTFLGWKEERVVSKFNDGRIVMVTANDPLSWQKKAKNVVGVADLELGFSEMCLKWTSDKKVLMFVCEKLKQVVGCLVMEACNAGYRMYPSIEGVEVDTCAEETTPCKIGVSRIWTAVHRRRRRVASRMFQALLRLAGDINPDDVAFSIPSPDGKMLARSVMGREDFKVYGFLTR